MYVEYNVRNISLFRVLEVLLIMPSTDIADTELYCLLHFISSVLNQNSEISFLFIRQIQMVCCIPVVG